MLQDLDCGQNETARKITIGKAILHGFVSVYSLALVTCISLTLLDYVVGK
jgi:hypothetical protein